MKLMPSRRLWRGVYRRLRVYIPLLLIVALALLLILPINARWLARRIEHEAVQRLNLALTLERASVLISEGRLELTGLRVSLANSETPPFTLSRVLATGPLSGLLAGDGSWPERIVLEAPSAFEIEASETGDGYRLVGEGATLLEVVRKAQDALAGASVPGTTQPPAGGRRTPEVVVRNATVLVPGPGGQRVALAVDQVTLAPRPGGASAIVFTASGRAQADSTEDWRLSGFFDPATRRAGGRVSVTGLVIPFHVPTLGRYAARLRDPELRIDVMPGAANGGRIDASLDVSVGRFELGRDRPGSERWIDRSLTLRLRGAWNEAARTITVSEAALDGDQVSLAVSGVASVDYPNTGTLTLGIRQLPRAAHILARSEIERQSGLRVEAAVSSPTLELEANVSGPLALPEQLDGEAALRLAGWSIEGAELPTPLLLRTIDFRATPTTATLERLDVSLGDFRVQGSMEVPLPGRTVEMPKGRVELRAEGDAQAALDLARRLDVVTDEVVSARLPVLLAAESDLVLTSRETGSGRVGVDLMLPSPRAQLSWGEGRLVLRRIPGTIEVDPGSLLYDRQGLNIRQLAAAIGSTRVRLSAFLSGGPLDLDSEAPTPVRYEGVVNIGGRIEDVGAALAPHITLPMAPDYVTGAFRAEARLWGDTERLLEPYYEVHLNVEEATATIPVPGRPLTLRRGSLDLFAQPEELRLDRFSLVLHDGTTTPSVVMGRLTADSERITADVDVRSQFQTLALILARDFYDLYAEGPLSATGTASLIPKDPIPEGPDLIRRWAAAIAERGHNIGIQPDNDLLVKFDVRYRPEGPVQFFGRDFPMRIENIRGNARFNNDGLFVDSALADFGTTRDAKIKGRLTIGRPSRNIPSVFSFEADMANLEISPWLTGWGEQPWATRASPPYPPRASTHPDRIFTVIEGTIRTAKGEFMGYHGSDFQGRIRYDIQARKPYPLIFTDLTAKAYGGEVQVPRLEFQMVHPDGKVRFDLPRATFQNIDVTGFLTDMRRTPDPNDGKLTGDIWFRATLLDQPTYLGGGKFTVEHSSFIGGQVLRPLRGPLRIGSNSQGRDTTISATYLVANREIQLSNLEVRNPKITLLANGTITFDANILLKLTAKVIGQHLGGIPIVSDVVAILGDLGDVLLSYRVTGTIFEPRFEPIPLMLDDLGLINRRRVSGGVEEPTRR